LKYQQKIQTKKDQEKWLNLGKLLYYPNGKKIFKNFGQKRKSEQMCQIEKLKINWIFNKGLSNWPKYYSSHILKKLITYVYNLFLT